MNNRSSVIDALMVGTLGLLAVITIASLFLEHTSRWVTLSGLAGIVAVALALVWARFATRPDHVRALQSHKMLEVANRSLAHLREGLTEESAEQVCRIVLSESEAAAVAITDTERVLGFAGIGEDHHSVGGPIITKATHETLETNATKILETQAEIGCPRKDCLLRAAIVVPLQSRGEPVGTLKFYYTTARLLNETQVTMVEGLAQLLSTQLELSELEAQTQLACRMELKALQAQINPHFMFNTINTIASLVRTDPARARELLREFARFYRRTLEENQELVPLSRELEYARSYLIFERARFGDRIRVNERVGSGVEDVQVPAFILQPLVENCVQHGMRPDGPLNIEIAVERDDGAIIMSVSDDGRGIEPEALARVLEAGTGKGLGIALRNVQDRVRGHYGPGSGLAVSSEQGVGTTVTVTLVQSRTDASGGDRA